MLKIIEYPFMVCARFLLGLGKVLGLNYNQISVAFNLWLQGGIIVLTSVAPFVLSVMLLSKSFTWEYLAYSILFLCNFVFWLLAFFIMLRHYHLPIDHAFYLCVKDLEELADKCRMSYYAVNLLIFVFAFLVVIGWHVFATTVLFGYL